MTNKTENQNKFTGWEPPMHLARFLHQDQLMWSRLQTFMVVQTAAIALAFYLGKDSKAAAAAIGFGFAVSVCVGVLYFVDRHLRDIHNKALSGFHGPLRWLGKWIFIIIAVAFFIADAFALAHLGFKFW